MSRLLALTALAPTIFSFGLLAQSAGSVPIIYSTDLFHPHDDPDDHFDLATLFSLPEFDIRAIVLDLGHLQRKAPGDLPVKQLRYLTGRPAPLLTGLQNPLRYPEDKALDQFEPDTPSAILRLLKDSKSKTMLIATGSLRDFAAAFNRDPDLFRAKVARLYIADGNSAGADLQWNPRLDPQAYLRLMRSDLPIYWAPGFGGPETLADLAAGKLATRTYQAYWKFTQGDLLEALPRPLQNYFLYALGRKEPAHEDPIEYLTREKLEEPLRSEVWAQTRHMWSTVTLYDAAARSLYRQDSRWAVLGRPERGYQRAKVYEFIPAAVTLDRDLRTKLNVPANEGAFRVLRVTDTANYQAAMLGSLRGLLAAMPAAESATATDFGKGAGAWPVQGALYEVSPEYFPNHSLNELTARIPRLNQLGVSVIYLTPIFKCLGTAQYLITDFYAINPRYGTEADLKRLVSTAHANGIRVLMDLVTSLTYEGTGIFEQHPDWILRGNDGQRQRYYPMPIFGWALDCMNPEVIRYFTDVARYYVQKFDVDGWRVDSPTDNYDHDKVSGDHTRTKLLRSVRSAVNAVKKDSIFVAEVSGPTVLFGRPESGTEPLFDEMLEAAYDYEYCGFLGGDDKSGYSYVNFDGPVAASKFVRTNLDHLVKGQWTSRQFAESMLNRKILFGRLRANFIENHDTERVAKAFPSQSRALFVLAATMPGIPVVHAGQEIGSKVHPDAGGSRNVVVDWEHGDSGLEAFYTRVLAARRSNPALSGGDFADAWISGDPAIAYVRGLRGSRVLVALNFSSKPARFVAAAPGGALRDELTGAAVPRGSAAAGQIEINLEAYGYRLIRVAADR